MTRYILTLAVVGTLLLCSACSLALQPEPTYVPTDLSLLHEQSATTEEQTEETTEAATEAPTEETTEAETEKNSELSTDVTGEDVSERTPGTAQLTVQWAEDAQLQSGGYDSFEAEIDPQVQIVFTADHTLRDVRILSLFVSGAEGDKVQFDQTVLYRQSTLTPERPLVVATTFFGDLPNNGISYTDTDGTVKRFAVGISGEDGSLLLTPF